MNNEKIRLFPLMLSALEIKDNRLRVARRERDYLDCVFKDGLFKEVKFELAPEQ